MVPSNVPPPLAKRVAGVIQAIDVLGRMLTLRSDGVSTTFDVAPDCVIVLHGERVKLRLVQPSDSAVVAYEQRPEGLWAHAVTVETPRALRTLARPRVEDARARLLPPTAWKYPTMSRFLVSPRSRVILIVAAVAIVVGIVAARPMVVGWLGHHADEDSTAAEKKTASHELVRDRAGHVLMRISEEAARTLDVTPQTIKPAEAAVKKQPLPPLEGTLAYLNDNLYPVRPRFAGEVVEFAQVASTSSPESAAAVADHYKDWQPTRPIGFGDKVRQGQMLAVIWSKDLGDKKAALIDAMIDLRRDRQRLEDLGKLYQQGATSRVAYDEAKRTVQHDASAVNAAERILRIWKLTDSEIEAVKKEAEIINPDKRDPKKEKNWARVEVRAPHDGTIVEKNTNLGDWVDPTSSNPMFRIADLNVLAVWVHPLEEYLPILSRLAQQHKPSDLSWKIHLQAVSQTPLAILDQAGQSVFEKSDLEGPILRIAPSVDPTQRTLLVMGQVDNKKGRLLIGESITATIYVRPGPDLVVIPTTALNEERGQSIVFVQPDPNKLEFVQRRVAVVDRFVDVVFVRSKLTSEDRQASAAAATAGMLPIEPLMPGERVVTRGVPMLTYALRDLLAKEGQ
jgi:cobalt-zinc-cadmium efflux system membrane fusion protein